MSKPPLVLEAHGKHAQAVHFTRDGKRLVSSGQDAHVRVWSLPLTAPIWPRWLIGLLAVGLLGIHLRRWRRAKAANTAVGKATT